MFSLVEDESPLSTTVHDICLEQFGHEIVYLLFNTEKNLKEAL